MKEIQQPFWVLIAVAGVIILLSWFLGLWIYRRRNAGEKDFDRLEGHEFEYYCADLLKRKGYTEVEVTRGSGDFGADILAQKEGITFAIQCKCYTSLVGVKAVQEALAGREYYDCMVGAVLTNQYFTAPAVEAAGKLKILLWDRG